jgi:CheY-like chemotaxis protein
MAKRVLVADDNPLIRKMLCQLFEREDDYDICAEAENGEQAIELALKLRPDLVILDFAMPVLNGLEAARQLKKIMPNVPIILFTQHAKTGFALHDYIDRVFEGRPSKPHGTRNSTRPSLVGQTMKNIVEAIAGALVDNPTRFKSARLNASTLPSSSCAPTRVISGR